MTGGRPCIYCSAPTKSVYRVCLDHTDLIKLDPFAPSALDNIRAGLHGDAELAAELASSQPALMVSSAIDHVPPERANGEPMPGVAVALDSLGATA